MLQRIRKKAPNRLARKGVEKLLIELERAAANMRNDVDDRQASSSSRAASSVPADQ